MGLWAFYFLAKVFLFFEGRLQIHFFLNLLLAWFLGVRLSASASRSGPASFLRLVAGSLGAFLLLWYDSWLAPLLYTMRFLRGARAAFSLEYQWVFVTGYFDRWDTAVLVLLFGLCFLLRKSRRLGQAAVLALCLAGSVEAYRQLSTSGLDLALSRFYQAQAGRVIDIPKEPSGPPFDVVLIHVCSLSWDDLRAAGMEGDPFLKRFDVLLTGYNSAASHSAAAAIRLLRSACGQSPEGRLRQPAAYDCYLLDDLRSAGFATASAWDNPGRYFEDGESFNDLVATYGHADPPRDIAGLPIVGETFDGEPMVDDYDVLARWWREREASKVPRAALFYNTLVLHAGTRRGSRRGPWGDPVEDYRRALAGLFSDLERFCALLRSSGRNVVVILAPEHGRGLAGSPMQAPDYREIPLPDITLVPVGVRLIGDIAPGARLVVSKETDPQAVAALLGTFLRSSPFTGAPLAPAAVSGIPDVPFVAENGGAKVMRSGSGYFYFGKDRRWVPVPARSYGPAPVIVRANSAP